MSTTQNHSLLEEIPKTCVAKMQKSVSVFENNLKGIRAGRASADILNPIQIEAYGNKVQLVHQANISVIDEGRALKIEPWDKNIIPEIKKSISAAGLGLNPIIEDKSLKIVIPALTEQRRKELIKIINKYHTKAKDDINNVRSQYMGLVKKPKKDQSISEDNKSEIIKIIQDATDKHMAHINQLLKTKENDIIQI